MKPRVQAILLADHVYKDEFTGKYIVSGIHDTYLFNPNPPPEPKPGDIPLDMQRAGAPYVYVNLTEFNGKFNFELRYLSLSQDRVIAAFSFEMTSYDPLKTVQFALAFPSVPKVEDTIALELLCDGEVIGSQRIVVTKLENAAKSKNDGDLKY
jgi:hypothetical protein